MSESSNIMSGNFTRLAKNYSKFRPHYSDSVLKSILALVGKPISEIDFIDVGAGTGIWTRMVAKYGVRSIISVEPNDDMRSYGISDSKQYNIKWFNGSGEATGLDKNSGDLLSMASSFHWVDFNKGTKEFARVLRPNGRFVALWNPRLIEGNQLLVEIEDYLTEIHPNLIRKSSGRSGITSTLTKKLSSSSYFDDVIYIEGRHMARQTPEQYMGIWWSVNDIRVQIGENKFYEFMDFIEKRIKGLEFIETTYLTRAWAARRV